MILGIRHASTKMDSEASKGALQGWDSVVGLDDVGQKLAQNAAHTVCELPIYKIFSSDLTRAVQTAEEVAGSLRKEVNFLPALRCWDVGDLAGQPYSKIAQKLDILVANPKQKAPGGESVDAFLARFLPVINTLQADKRIFLLVTHSHNMEILISMAKSGGKGLERAVLLSNCEVDPGGILILNRDWQYEVINPPKDLLYRAKRATKEAVLYLHEPGGTNYSCEYCHHFIKDIERCTILGENDKIEEYGSCGLYSPGGGQVSTSVHAPRGVLTKTQVGYVESQSGFSCAQCEYFIGSRQNCQKVEPDSPGDDPNQILPTSCCNSWSPKSKS